MSMITLLISILWFSKVSSFTGANQANIDCLKTLRSQIEDPNGYLTSWDFRKQNEGIICGFRGVDCWGDDENRVMSINLSDYGLRGEFPRGFKGCTDMTGLDLSRNNFFGHLPSNISSLLPFLTILDLSYNKFSGEVPVDLASITFLNTLLLEHNQFTGHLPPQLVSLRRLKVFSVAYNFLTDPVPSFDPSLNIAAESYANNSGLCSLPLDACHEAHDHEEGLIQLGEIAAAVGAAIFVPIGAGLDWFFSNRKKQRQGNIRYRGRI